MAGSSPARRSYQWSSPQQSVLSDILYEDRNSEARHKLLLETAKREHERVRAEAERIYKEHVQKEERNRLLEAKRNEEERIRLEEQIAADRLRLQALKAKKVTIPPLPEPQPDPAPRAAPPAQSASAKTSTASPATHGTVAKNSPLAQPPSLLGGVGAQKPATQNPFSSTKPNPFAPRAAPPSASPGAQQPNSQPSAAKSNPFAPAQSAPQTNGTATSQVTRTPATSDAVQQADRYVVIHRTLKQLRKSMDQQIGMNPALKSRMGDMRREVRKTVGQLTTGTGVNRQQIIRLVNLLKEAMANSARSQLIDASFFVVDPRDPVDGAQHNEPQLPSLFLYLLNIFAKAAISQFISEGGAKPDTADPIGIVVADIFSNPDFHWRGKSLIDILLAKYRVCCPVLFGYRGSEKTEQGRQRLGWMREGGVWVGDQQHMDRMTGLGAGFAAISLRNFGKSKKQNPYPPTNYWTAMARIVNTPPAEISNTQGVVLKAMIQNFEKKFLDAYGNAAIAALRLALIAFPAKAPVKTAAINSLHVLAQMLERDTGLKLE